MIKKVSYTVMSIIQFLNLMILYSCCPKVGSYDVHLFQPYSNKCENGYYDAIGMNVACIPETWIVKKILYDELKNKIITEKNRKRWLRCPGEPGNHFWLEVDSLIGKGGNLIYFDSPKKYWEALAGRSGWAIEINGKIEFVYVDAVN